MVLSGMEMGDIGKSILESILGIDDNRYLKMSL